MEELQEPTSVNSSNLDTTGSKKCEDSRIGGDLFLDKEILEVMFGS